MGNKCCECEAKSKREELEISKAGSEPIKDNEIDLNGYNWDMGDLGEEKKEIKVVEFVTIPSNLNLDPGIKEENSSQAKPGHPSQFVKKNTLETLNGAPQESKPAVRKRSSAQNLWPVEPRAESVWNIPISKKNNLGMDPHPFRCEKKTVIEERYEIMDLIGKGSFGEVKKIKEKSSGLIRALKIFPKEKCRQTDKFNEEIEILQKLDHPNLLRLYEFYQDYENYYLVTEYCKGGDLLKKITNLKRLPEAQAARIMRQIFAAVEYCHRMKIVHRDLKPENIVFEENTVCGLSEYNLFNYKEWYKNYYRILFIKECLEIGKIQDY